MPKRHLSIQHKVYFALGSIFLVMMITVVSIAISSEKQLSYQMVRAQLQDKASSYLDTMNMLMLSGAIANRELLRQKILADDNITDVRMLRSDKVDKLYGKGLPHEYPADDIDRMALNGQETFIEQDNDEGHTLSLIRPVIAEENYRGTNCLTCHQAKQGDVLGAIRITYDLNELDQTIRSHMLTMSATQALLFIGALLLLSLLIRRMVLNPIRAMQHNLINMQLNSDLSHQISVTSHDEIGQASEALNAMTQRFSDSLRQVVSSADELSDAARHIDTSSHNAQTAAKRQSQATAQMQHAIRQLHASIGQVTHNAEQSSAASEQAKSVAHDGVDKTDEAAATIEQMNQAIQHTTTVIGSLDERTTNVAGVLEVIKGIAEQTNLLALNAAIEAARAGDSGRGFAVVADEVRTLSQRTHESAQEIESMIEHLQQEAKQAVTAMQNTQNTAGNGMQRVNEAASALHSMTQHVEHMSALNRETVTRMQEQISLGEDVSQGIKTISQYSGETLHNAEESTRISASLVGLAKDLARLVKQFKL